MKVHGNRALFYWACHSGCSLFTYSRFHVAQCSYTCRVSDKPAQKNLIEVKYSFYNVPIKIGAYIFLLKILIKYLEMYHFLSYKLHPINDPTHSRPISLCLCFFYLTNPPYLWFILLILPYARKNGNLVGFPLEVKNGIIVLVQVLHKLLLHLAWHDG